MDRLRSLESDLEVVVQQLLLPADLREGLPAVDRVWEGFETGPVTDSGELQRWANLKRDVLARLARDDPAAGFERAIGALERQGSRPPLVFLHSTLPHGPWRYLPDGHQYSIDGKEYPGLAAKGWTGPQWQVDQGFQRHVLQVQYVDRLLGRLLDALRARDLFDDAVIVVTSDHGAAFMTGQPRRPANRANVGVIAPVPLFVKLPGQPDGRVDDRAVRTIDVLPTIAKAAGVRLPWKADGIPADEREVDPDAPIDISHMGKPVLTEALGSVLAKRRAREAVEARLLRDGVYAIGPRPELISRRVAAPSGGKHVMVDDHERRAAVVRLGPRRGPRARHGARRRRQRARAGDDAGLPRRGTVGLRRTRRRRRHCAKGPTPCRCSRCSRAASCDRWTEAHHRPGRTARLTGSAQERAVGAGRETPRTASTSRSTRGRSVMTPSTPSSSSSRIAAGSLTVQTCTGRPAR